MEGNRNSSCRDVGYTRWDSEGGDETFVALNETNFYFKRQISIHLLRVGARVAARWGSSEDLPRINQKFIA